MHRQKIIAQRLLCANLKTPVFTAEKSYPLTFNGSAQTLLRNYKIYGNSVQDGTPSPDNPIEIESVGDLVTDEASEYYGKYDVPVVARGRNLIPMFTFKTFTSNGVTFTNNKDGSITLNGTPTAYTATPIMYLPDSTLEILRNNVCVLTGFHNYEKNIGLVLSVGLNGSWVKYIYLNRNTYANFVKVDLRSIEFDKIAFLVRSEKNNVLINNLTVKPFLEVGTTMPTSFEPYITPVTTNIFLDEPLRKVGDYADYVDFEKQKVVRNIIQGYITSASFIHSKTKDVCRMTINKDIINTLLKNTPMMAVSFPNATNRWSSTSESIFNHNTLNGYIYLILKWNRMGLASDDGETVYRIDDETKTALTDKEIVSAFTDYLNTLEKERKEINAVIATPTEETVKLPALPQFKGTTIYEVQTNTVPSGIEAKYC